MNDYRVSHEEDLTIGQKIDRLLSLPKQEFVVETKDIIFNAVQYQRNCELADILFYIYRLRGDVSSEEFNSLINEIIWKVW